MTASRREFLALAAQGVAAAAQTAALELDHIKLRVVNSGASAIFYRSLFGGELVSLRNSTLNSQTNVEEFFLKLGAADFPYLMFAQLRAGETPGLDHISILAGAAAYEAAVRAGATVEQRSAVLRLKDVDGTPIEVGSRPTWGHTAPTVRLPLPSNLQGVLPAFEPVEVKSVSLGSADAAKAASIYRAVFGGAPRLQFRPGATGLARVEIAIRPANARRILEARGIRAYGSRNEVLFRDPDGNEIALTTTSGRAG